MAEGLLRSILPSELAGLVRVRSAGTGAVDGDPATPLAIRTAREHGIDVRPHRSAALTAAVLRESDFVLCMEPMHVTHAQRLTPEVADRLHLITDHGTETADAAASGIHDPLGGTAVEYEDTFNRIRSHLLRWLPRIREAVERREGVR